MLSKEVFFEMMDKLLILYPSWNVALDDKGVVKTWYEQFQHMSDDDFRQMIDDYIENEKFNPTVAGLKEYGDRVIGRYIPSDFDYEKARTAGEDPDWWRQ